MKKIAYNSVVVTALQGALYAANFAVFVSIAALFGASWQTDAFFLALTLPTFFVGSVVNAITSVFVPILVECRVNRPDRLGQLIGAAILYGSVACTALALFIGLSLLGWANLWIGRDNLTTFFILALEQALYMLPVVVIGTLCGVLGAVYNAAGKFWPPPATDAAGTLLTLILVVLLKPIIGVFCLPVGFLAGAALHLVLLIGLWPQLNVAVIWSWHIGPELKKSLRLSLPMLVAMTALYFISVVSRSVATLLPEGSVSVVDYANRISVGVTELLTGGVLLVVLTDWSQVVTQSNLDILQAKVQQTIRALIFIILPVVAILIALRHSVIMIALQRGEFDLALTAKTASVLLFFLVGIPLDAILRVYFRLFLVWQQTQILGLLSVIRLISVIIFSLVFVKSGRVESLALADILGLTIMMIGLVIAGSRRLGNTLTGLWLPLCKILLCAGAAYVSAYFVDGMVEGMWPWPKFFVSAVSGFFAYILLARALKLHELQLMFQLLLPKMPREITV